MFHSEEVLPSFSSSISSISRALLPPAALPVPGVSPKAALTAISNVDAARPRDGVRTGAETVRDGVEAELVFVVVDVFVVVVVVVVKGCV